MNKKNNSKKKNVVITVCLIIALLVAGVYAFLTANETKTNVFTIGSVDLDLNEPSWDPEDPEHENVIPGQVLEKDPQVENTGENPEWVFLTVTIPAVESGEVAALNGGTESVIVTAYGIQENYYSKTTAEDIWIAYTNRNGTDTEPDYETMFGAEISDSTSIGQIVRTIYRSEGNDDATFNPNWTQIGSYCSVDDAGNYAVNYIYTYGLLDADETTEPLFTHIKLIDNIGEVVDHIATFVENDEPVELVPFKGYGSYITTPSFRNTESTYWSTENDTLLPANFTVQASNLSDGSNNPIITAITTTAPGVVKLIPLDSSSTAVIQRGEFAESYVAFGGLAPTCFTYQEGQNGNPDRVVFSSATVITPYVNSYGYASNVSTNFMQACKNSYYISGLEEGLTAETLASYITVYGDGYYKFVPSVNGNGTGSMVEVYDNDDNLIEVFIIIIHGDIDGNAISNETEIDMLITEVRSRAWSEGTAQNRVNYIYRVKAVDLSLDGLVTSTDTACLKGVYNGNYIINQATGTVESSGS